MDRRKGSCFAATGDLGTNSGWGNLRPTETAPVLGSAPRRSALRKNRRLARTEIVPQLSPPRSVGALHRTATRRALWLPSLSLQRDANFREGMGNGLRLRINRNDGHKPKQQKSYYEKQKKYPDLHRRRTLHPRNFSEFVAGRARTDVPWHAYRRHLLLRRQSRSRFHGHRQLEREYRSRDAGPGHAQRLLRWQPSLVVRVQRVGAGLVVRRRLRVRGVRRQRDGYARQDDGSGDVLLARRTRRRLPARASLRLADVLRTGEPRRWIKAARSVARIHERPEVVS